MSFTPPPVPAELADLPRTRAGLVVPGISVRHRDGTAVLGMVDHRRALDALVRGLCQICLRPLDTRIVALARPRDLVQGWICEPAMHRVCADYAILGCPMLAGVLTHYRASRPASVGQPCGDRRCHCIAWAPENPHGPPPNAPAEPWYAVWLAPDAYRVGVHPTLGRPAVDISRVRPSAIHPLPETGATPEQADMYRAILHSRAFLSDLW